MDEKSDRIEMLVENYNTKFIILGIVAFIFLSPITYQLFKSEASSFVSSLIAIISPITLTGVLMYITYNILNQSCQQSTNQQSSTTRTRQGRTFFKVFSSIDLTSNTSGNLESKPPTSSNNRRGKIDPKYFKPRYIMHELMSMWGTTYTVITWGSVWVIGGTIVATEKLAQKIKTKCSREQQSDTNDYSSRSMRRGDSSESYSSSSIFDRTTDSDNAQNKSSLRKVRSWTRKSYASARRRFNKFFGSAVPQIMSTEDCMEPQA